MQLYGRVLQFGMQGPDVHLWQARLQVLGHNIPDDEVANDYFGQGTKAVVTNLQQSANIRPANGTINIPTARLILEKGAALVTELGEQTYKLTDVDTRLRAQNRQLDGVRAAVDQQSQSLGSIDAHLGGQAEQLKGIGASLDRQSQSLGSIDRQIGNLSELLTGDTPLALNARGKAVAALHSGLTRVGYRIPQHELSEQVFGVGTRNAVRHLQGKCEIRRTGVVDEKTAAALTRAVAVAETNQQHVEGRLFFDNGRPAGEVVVRLYSRGLGDAAQLLGEAETDADGYYAFAYNTNGKAANLEVRAVGGQSQEISLSRTKFGADRYEVFNLVAPASIKPLAPEYERLTGILEGQLGDLEQLAAVEENDKRRDLTYLHQATGWDARLIALLALAVKRNTDTGLRPDILYALFRVGLPTDTQLLARVSITAAGQALAKANEAGIVAFSDDEIAKATRAFEAFARKTRLAATAPGGLSTFGELLEQRSKPEVPDDTRLIDQEKGIFADLYFAHRGKPAELWQEAADRGITQPKIDGLRLQGKLAYLTFNNAALTERLQQEIEVSSTAQGVAALDNLVHLVDLDLYRAEAWEKRLRDMGGDIESLIPPAYTAKKPEDRLGIYAADLARKVRLSFPTQVVRRMVEKKEVSLGERHDDIGPNVSSFLRQADAFGFRLGQTPVDRFVADHTASTGELFGIAQEAVAETTAAVKQLYRQYQITPTDEALMVVADLGFASAQDVVAFTHADFLGYFGQRFDATNPQRSREIADLIYRKAQQVSAVTFNLLTMARLMDTSPRVYAMFPPPNSPEEGPRMLARANLIRHFPALEGLLGSMDFCECEHCRSALSPAAYLVDLLQFLDPDDKVWEEKLDKWRDRHDGVPYPFKDSEDVARWEEEQGIAYNPTVMKPYDVLALRRPDLPQLSLTCENTNTTMPYIDLVNEVFEYYVAHRSEERDGLEDFRGHDTGDATTGELLAEPQNVVKEAYDTLRAARYPLTLPFDLWLETVRQFFDHFAMPLWQVLEVFRTTEGLFDDGSAYDRAAIFVEYLGLSPTEYDIFSEFDPLSWHELYGYDDDDVDDDVVTGEHTDENGQRTDLNSAKALSRRLGVSYQELADIIQTGFVNPLLDKLVILYKLGVTVQDVRLYMDPPDDASLSGLERRALAEERAAFRERLAGLSTKFGFDAESWLTGAWRHGEFNRILVLADPDTGCNFDETIPRYATGDPADALAFLKINLFVRLWKKLGWTVEEVDRALQAFLPGGIEDLSGGAFRTALVYMAHLKALEEQLDPGRDSRLKLLTLWSDLPTTGRNPLYAQLFLTRSMLSDAKTADVFDHPLGKYLRYFDRDADDRDADDYQPFRWNPDQAEDVATGNVSLRNHLLAVQGALGLTANEISDILNDGGLDLDTTALSLANLSLLYRYLVSGERYRGNFQLSLANLSLLYRYRLLAKALKLSVADLIALKGLSGIDPFAALSVEALETVAEDHPLTGTLRFVETAAVVKESGFKIEDLDYLLRHRFDPAGRYRAEPATLLAMVKSLAANIHTIQNGYAVPDAAELTDEMLQQALSLVLPPNVVETFMSMWTATVEYQASLDVAPEFRLSAVSFAAEPAIQVRYDEVLEVQTLTYRGVLVASERRRLEAAYPSAVLASLLDDISDQVQRHARAFFDAHFVDVEVSFLAREDFDLLFAPPPLIPSDLPEADKLALRRAQEERARANRARLLEAFLPYLRRKLIQQRIAETLASQLTPIRRLSKRC